MAGNFFVVLFEPTAADASVAADAAPRSLPDPVLQLERELERLKNHLRDNVEQHEASTEELKASNEELQAMNEELRSATEELETGREELQSINEELTTVNQELKSKVDELGHANSDMHNLMDATAIATVFLDRELRITRYTPSAVALFNLIPSDLGRPLTDLTTQLEYPGLGEDALRVLERLVPVEREVLQTGGQSYLARLLPYRTLDDRIAGVVLSFVNTSARKHAEQAMRNSDERMRLLLDNAHEYAIFTTDIALKVTSWNAGAERLLGYNEAEMLGQSGEIIFTPEDREASAPQQEARTALQYGRAADDRFHQRKDETRFWASGALMSMRDDAGHVAGFVKILRDQSAQRITQLALEASQRELTEALEQNEKARQDLQIADAAKDRFIAVLSHELRNPLASIASGVELLGSSSLDAERQARTVEVLRRQSLNMKLLMDDLLDISRLTLGRFVLHTQPLTLATVLQSAVDTTMAHFDAARHTLKVELPPNDVAVEADPLRLTQVVANLLVNAAKYTPPGGRIRLHCEITPQEACIAVTDNGIGMQRAEIDRMFEMFAQGGSSASTWSGLGIGLALVRNIVEMHGGRVTASSEGEGQGSEFRVVLPRVPAPLAQPSSSAWTGTNRRKHGDRALKQCIVVADDNVDAAWMMAQLLGAAGHTVHVAHTGQEALGKIEEYRPTVALLDIGMPNMDGYETARRARAQLWGRNVMLIAATGYGQDTDQQMARQAGFSAHLTKPVDLARLHQLINSAGQA